MRIFKRFSVTPKSVGLLYWKNQLMKTLEPGIYEYWDWRNFYHMEIIPTNIQLYHVPNQEVLTKDNIALRFSYLVEFAITSPTIFAEQVNVFENYFHVISKANQLVHSYSQIYMREAIAKIVSTELNEQKGEILQEIPAALKMELAKYGIEINKQYLRDVTFPKAIQNLFAKKLEAKIRAEADLENARSVVASARALKNASKLMENDSNIRFMQWMETITKISGKGKHTFVLGEMDKVKATK